MNKNIIKTKIESRHTNGKFMIRDYVWRKDVYKFPIDNLGLLSSLNDNNIQSINALNEAFIILHEEKKVDFYGWEKVDNIDYLCLGFPF